MRITRLGRADIYALTAMTPADVERIAAATDPGHTRRRPPRLTHRDRVLIALTALRTNLTERALAVIFGIRQPTAHRTIRDMMAAVEERSTQPVRQPRHADPGPNPHPGTRPSHHQTE